MSGSSSAGWMRWDFPPPEKQALVNLVRASVRLVPDPTADAARIGGSRLGGEPDLPVGADWPDGDDGPLSFVAQVNLGDLVPLLPGEGLPTSGLLSFFYDTESMPWGFDPADRGSWAVIHSAADDELVRRPVPDGVPAEGRTDGKRPGSSCSAPEA